MTVRTTRPPTPAQNLWFGSRPRIAATLGAAALATSMAAVGAAPAASARHTVGDGAAASEKATACPRGKGVSVVVDFGTTEKISCASGDPTSGLAALRGAGFTVAMVARFPAAVCRINGRPTATQDACVVMPPTTKYWSYWHAARGGKWTYATTGAGSYNPKPGTVEGWAYGAGKPPTVAPPK